MPIWNLPPFIVHQTVLAADVTQLPWHVAKFAIDREVWPKVIGEQIVGVIDTGASQSHIEAGELTGQVKDVADFTRSRSGPWDVNGHGSHVAGIIAGKSFGIAKNCAKLLCAKALGDSGSGSDLSIASAILWCVDNGATVLNLSLGSPQSSPTINGMLREVSQQGVLCVCAAGNSGGPVEHPAVEEYVLAVTAIDEQMRLCSFSSRGTEADTCAPGGAILSLGRGGSFAVLSGTSMAAPWVAAMLAVKRSVDIAERREPLTDVDGVAAWLGSTAIDLGAPGRDWMFGFGMPDPSKLIAMIEVPAPVVTSPDVGIVIEQRGTKWAPTGWEKI